MRNFNVLNQNRDFLRAYKRGQSYVSKDLVTYVLKNRGLGYRIGITASKKVGNSVKRNRARRVIKAALYDMPELPVGNFDIIFVARTRTAEVKSTDVFLSMKEHFMKADLLR